MAEPATLQAARAYDAVASEYDDHYVGPQVDAENELVGQLLERHVGGGRILDVGCGTGLAVDLLSERSKREVFSSSDYVGIDASAEMIKEARMNHPGYRFEHMTMESLGVELPSEMFSHVISTFGSFSYTPLPWIVIWNMALILRPGGTLFVMAYSYRRLQEKDWLLENVEAPRSPYDAKELRRLTRSVELRHISVRGFGYGSSYPAREWRTLGRLFPSRGRYVVLQAVK